MKLIGTQNAKTLKGEKKGWLTGIVYLAPGSISGHSVCPNCDEGCSEACLYTAGRGAFNSVQRARVRKTKLFFNNRAQFMADLRADINALKRIAERRNMRPAVRLNGTSDIDWLGTGIMASFPDVQFYDYTAVLNRLLVPQPKNYHLTFSRKTDNDKECCRALAMGFNVAVVFDKVPVGWKFMGHTVVDGDLSDLRFLDSKRRREPVIVGLKAKGRARHATSEFVVRLAA